MAGDWIKIETVTPGKPEIDAIADALGVSINEVLGGLVRLWIWADQQTRDGNAASVTKTAIDRHSGVTGFADAMLLPRVGWLESCESGGFRFPRFDRHNGQTAKARALTSKRVARHKAKKGNAGVTPGALPREEKRREEKSKRTPPVVPLDEIDYPPGTDTADVRQALADWCAYKRSRGEAYKSPARQLGLLLRKFPTPAAFVAAIEHSMANNYAGCFSPKEGARGRTTNQPDRLRTPGRFPFGGD